MRRRMIVVRQGDVCLYPLERLPLGAKPLSRGWYVIPGEEGHMHTIHATGGVRFFEGNGRPIIFVPEGEEAVIKHGEHGTSRIPSGIWEVLTGRQYRSKTERASSAFWNWLLGSRRPEPGTDTSAPLWD